MKKKKEKKIKHMKNNIDLILFFQIYDFFFPFFFKKKKIVVK